MPERLLTLARVSVGWHQEMNTGALFIGAVTATRGSWWCLQAGLSSLLPLRDCPGGLDARDGRPRGGSRPVGSPRSCGCRPAGVGSALCSLC